jgi:prepilin-type N-terminal cleavage/methylation domain-containing protein
MEDFMSTQKLKKGFTLIELMVVIVIIGILAAIAIPKLFGMTAKAKASEVGPAVGTWSKLEQAFVTENGVAGSFRAIGYTPPGDTVVGKKSEESKTSNFYYESTTAGDGVAYSNDTTKISTWQAKNLVPLNNCTKDSVWLANFNRDSIKATTIKISGGDVKGKVAVGNCGSLTPQFGYLR